MKINEIIDDNNVLSSFQKEILLIGAISATPTQAYDATIGNLNLVTARDLLARLGYINVMNNELTLSPKGDDAVIRNNLMNDDRTPTDDGLALLKNVNINP